MVSRNSLRYLWLLIISDALRYQGNWWKHRGFLTTLAYRIRRARKYGNWYCRIILFPMDLFTGLIGMFASDAEIPYTAKIGPGLYLPHPQGVIIGYKTYVGSQVTIFQQVTLGAWNNGEPIIRSKVCIFAGAKIIGNCVIQRRAFIGANSVVVKDVPEWNTAVGVPAINRLRSDIKSSITQVIPDNIT